MNESYLQTQSHQDVLDLQVLCQHFGVASSQHTMLVRGPFAHISLNPSLYMEDRYRKASSPISVYCQKMNFP